MTEKFAWPKNFVNLKNFKIFKIGSFWHQIWKNRQKLSQKKLFWCWWRHRWRHSETLNIALYFHVYFIPSIFQLWCNISETNAMLYHMALSIGFIKNYSLRIYLQNWLRYRHSKFQCCLLNSAINFLARITKLNTIGDQHIGYVSWQFQRNRFSSCWHTVLGSWFTGVVCSAQRGLLTHSTCVLARLHKNRSHGQTKLQSNSPVVSKCSLYL